MNHRHRRNHFRRPVGADQHWGFEPTSRPRLEGTRCSLGAERTRRSMCAPITTGSYSTQRYGDALTDTGRSRVYFTRRRDVRRFPLTGLGVAFPQT